jgi:hypothetical protein
MVEIHAGLYHHGDHAAPRAMQIVLEEGWRCTSSVRAAALGE